MTNEKINLFSLHALSLYYQLHIYIVCKENKTYIEYNNLASNICIIYKNTSLTKESNTKYSVDLQVKDKKKLPRGFHEGSDEIMLALYKLNEVGACQQGIHFGG